MGYYIPSQSVTQRLNSWLDRTLLPYSAKVCLENFVLSCDNPDIDDVQNFISIDIINYPINLQAKLIEGFMYAYYNSLPKVVPCNNGFLLQEES